MIYDLTDSILQKKATFTSLDGNVVYGVNRQQKVNWFRQKLRDYIKNKITFELITKHTLYKIPI